MYRNRSIYLIAEWLCNWKLFINLLLSSLALIIILGSVRDNSTSSYIEDRDHEYTSYQADKQAKASHELAHLNASKSDNDLPWVREWKMVPRLPKAIIIGARKCGTRALIKFLELNPKIRTAQNEIHFFDRASQYSKGLDWYRSQMPDSYDDDVTIEKSPAYFITPTVPQRIKEMNSTIKLIVIVRDPVVRLISDFTQILANRIPRNNRSDELDSAAFERFLTRSDGGINENLRAVKTGMYAIHLEHWQKFFKTNQMIIVEGERLIKSPYDELNRLETFLGVPSAIRRDQFVFNATKGFYCIRVSGNADNDNDKVPHLNQNNTTGAKLLKTWSQVRCLSQSKGRKHVKVGEKLIDRLKRLYYPFNQYLYSMIGQKFNWME